MPHQVGAQSLVFGFEVTIKPSQTLPRAFHNVGSSGMDSYHLGVPTTPSNTFGEAQVGDHDFGSRQIVDIVDLL